MVVTITEKSNMISNTLRASASGCITALLASGSVADSISIAVTNNTADIFVQLVLDGAQVGYTRDRLAGQRLFPGETITLSVESDPTCQYDINASDEDHRGTSGQYLRFTIEGCGSGSVTLN